MAIIKSSNDKEKIINSLYSKKELGVNINDQSTKGITLEYFTTINKIINHYTKHNNESTKEKKKSEIIITETISSTLRGLDLNFKSELYKEKSFFEKVSFFLSITKDAIRTSKIDNVVEHFNALKEMLNKLNELKKKIAYSNDIKVSEEEISYENELYKFFTQYPEYKQAIDEFDRLKSEETKKIEQMNNLVLELNDFRQYILNEFNPIVLELLDLLKGNEFNFKKEYIEISEKLHQKIDYSFKSTSSKEIKKTEKLLKWDELRNCIEILEKDNILLDNEIDKIIGNEFFKNYINNELRDFNTIKSKLNSLIKQNEIIITKLPKIVKDIELENLKKELKSLEFKLQELAEQKTEYLNDIEEFNREYNLHLGELIKDILNLKKEILYKRTIKNKNLNKKYIEEKVIYNETKQTIEELKNTIIELEKILENIASNNEENYDEIKNAYDEIKEELQKLEEELLVQENELKETEEELKENEIFEEEYEEAKSTYEEFDNQYEHIKDTQKDIIKLNDEEKIELKKLWKKACKLCHPDIVTDELKEKAHEIMQALNDAYGKKDIEQVKKILQSLENGTTFKTISSDIEDKELLLNKIKEFEQNISDLEEEILQIKLDETFITISELDNWDEYFEELKIELTKQKNSLEKEAMEVLEDENKNLSEEKEIIVEENKTKDELIESENSQYSKYIQSIENPNFEKIRRYCNNLLNDNKADTMQEYLANNGKMYKAIIYDALEQFISKFDGKNISLVDWGCGQGIASMIVLDYIKEKQLNIKVSNSILIDDIKALSRAMVHTDILSYSDDIKISAYDLNSDISDILKKLDNQTVLNLIVNDKIYEKIKNIDFENDFFLCLSNQSNVNIDKFYKKLTKTKDVQNVSIRDTKIGKFKKFERIFKVNK